MIKSFSNVGFNVEKIKSIINEPIVDSRMFDQKVIFIVSTGRTGTHFLSHFFNKNFSDVNAYHEPKPDLFLLDINYLRNKVSEKRAWSMFKGYRKKLLSQAANDGKIYIESNSKVSFLLPLLKRQFSDYKVIHIVRDGRDVVRSKYSRKTSGKYVKDVYLFSDKDPKDRLNAGDFKDDPFRSRWAKLDRFSRICWHWMKKDSLIRREIENDRRCITVKFEDIFVKKDLNVWKNMIDFAGLTGKMVNEDILSYINNKRSNQVKDFELPDYKYWDDHKKTLFKEIAGDYMEKMGYKL